MCSMLRPRWRERPRSILRLELNSVLQLALQAEALGFGLCTRVVPPGEALAAAMELARTLATFPQRTLRADRASALAQDGLANTEALLQEWQGGRACLAEALRGAARFVQGDGRHGEF